MCDYCLRDIPKKYLTASLSWLLVSSRLKRLPFAQRTFFSSCVTFCVTYPKKFIRAPLSWHLVRLPLVQGATFSMRLQLYHGHYLSHYVMEGREKVMRRRDCVRNLDTPLVCARRHRQMTMKCAYSSVELQCSVPWAHG